MSLPERTTQVFLDGEEVFPQTSTYVLPVLVSRELLKEMQAGARLSRCGAGVQIHELGDGFVELLLTNGDQRPHG